LIENIFSIKTRYAFYIDVLEFLILFGILFLALHYINKLVKLPRLVLFLITVDLFLIFPRPTIETLKFIIRAIFYIIIQSILIIINLLKFSRVELIIILNLILLGIFAFKFLQKKKKEKLKH